MLGPLFFCVRFGLFTAQRNKLNKYPDKFSLWSLFILEDDFDLPEILIKEFKNRNKILYFPNFSIFFN